MTTLARAAKAAPPVDLDATAVAWFFDFDGTLAEIVDDPTEARPYPEVARCLGILQVAAAGAVAVVSGREIATLDELMHPLHLPAAGIHGLQRRSADGTVHETDADTRLLGSLVDKLADFARERPGVTVETKAASAALHYRRRPDMENACLALAEEIAAREPKLHLVRGKMVAELKQGHRTKADAIRDFMNEPPFRGRRPVFVGDDVTDEDGFVALGEWGGISVKIGPGETKAGYRLADTRAFRAWLARICTGLEAAAAATEPDRRVSAARAEGTDEAASRSVDEPRSHARDDGSNSGQGRQPTSTAVRGRRVAPETRPVSDREHMQPSVGPGMSRLVVVSNRVADLRKTTQSGGLAVGIADALKERGGVWFGWNGEIAELAREQPAVEEIGRVKTISVPLSSRDYREYYIGYANSVLWPLCHYRLDLVDYKGTYFQGYRRVNRRFAALLRPYLEPEDTIWVHDYHLIPLAGFLRALGCRQRIGFFLHIPFPPPDFLAASPNHAELVNALLQYDVIGFQSSTDVGNLRHYLEEHDRAEVLDDNRIRVGDRLLMTDRFPIGIDVAGFAEMAAHPPEDVAFDVMRRDVLKRKQIIGVDRLDYSKGLPERMQAFGRLLEEHPELERAVTYLQIAPPTREEVSAYSDIRQQLEGLAGSVNGRFADFNWTPIRYIHRSVPRDKLAALFRSSQVGLVTPLRDGMNLVAKEYVAAQHPADPGVLILSQFAGAAEELHEALIVNPYDVDEVARRLFQALNMPLAERERRHAALFENISRNDAGAWLAGYLAALEGRPEASQPAHTGR